MSKTLDELKTLRDEIKVKLHLASMEVKSEWEQLEPKLASLESKIEQDGQKAVAAANDLIDDLASAFRKLKDKVADK